MKKSWTAWGALFLSLGLFLTGCQKAEEPVPRHPLSSSAGPPTPETYQEVVGPKNLPQAKPAGNVRETIRRATSAAATPQTDPGKVNKAAKPKEAIQPVKEKKEDVFGPVKPPHPMPGA